MVSKESIGNSNIRKENRSVAEPFAPTDVNDIKQMQEILEIVKDPDNMKHLAGVSEGTEFSDIIAHYKKDRQERDGQVMLENKHVIGVFEVSPFDPSRLGNPTDESNKYPSWQIKSAILNRVAIKRDEHNKGNGTRLVKHAEKVAFEEHDYSTLIAAIILDPEQKEKYDQFLREGKLNKVSQDYEKNDPRGKVYIKNRGWKLTGAFLNQGGVKEGELNHVLIVTKTKADWLEEQAESQHKNNLKAA